uniref:Uncharacterized protein n=1 Tax=Leersia perrieri TaxID=77586 RepID=A0A0D9XCH8_9ORYZ
MINITNGVKSCMYLLWNSSLLSRRRSWCTGPERKRDQGEEPTESLTLVPTSWGKTACLGQLQRTVVSIFQQLLSASGKTFRPHCLSCSYVDVMFMLKKRVVERFLKPKIIHNQPLFTCLWVAFTKN